MAGLNCPFWATRLWYDCGESWNPVCGCSTVRAPEHHKDKSGIWTPRQAHVTKQAWVQGVGGSPCGYEAHQLNSWYESRGKRPASLALTERKGVHTCQIHRRRTYSQRLECIFGFWSIWRFYLWRRKSAKLWAARGSCSLWRTAAVLVLCCLTEKTGLHQCSLEEVGHNTDSWCHEGEGREEPRACRNHTTGFIHTYSNTMCFYYYRGLLYWGTLLITELLFVRIPSL